MRLLALFAALIGVERLPAQVVTGVGDDAVPLPRGGWRYTIAGRWNDYDERYVLDANGKTVKRGLLTSLASDNAGTAQFPALLGAESAIRALSAQSAFRVSLGTLETAGEVHQSIAPLSVEYGVTKRLSVRVLLPYAESRDASQVLLNRSGTGANVGLNPAYVTASSASTRAANGALLAQIDAARTALAGEIQRCAVVSATNCDAIRANPTGAQTLVTTAQQVHSGITTVYGGTAGGGAPLVPLSGSAAQQAVQARVTALRTGFESFGITALDASLSPTAANTVLGPGGTPRLGTDTLFGVGYSRLGNTRRAGVGDIDLTATWLLVDHFGADQRRRLLDGERGLRSTITGGLRFGTAGADRTDDPFDVPIGEGANALLVRSTTDLVWSRSLWLSATARVVKPMSDQVAIALPTRTVAGTFAPYVVGAADRTLGMRTDLEIAPRAALGQFFGVSGALVWQRWGSDRYDAGNTELSQPGMTGYEIAARHLTSAAIGASFSTLASYVRGRSKIAAEVLYSHTMPVAASGELPAVSTDRLEVRIYTGFPRR